MDGEGAFVFGGETGLNGQDLTFTLDGVAGEDGEVVVDGAADKRPTMKVDQQRRPVIIPLRPDSRRITNRRLSIILRPTNLEFMRNSHVRVVFNQVHPWQLILIITPKITHEISPLHV